MRFFHGTDADLKPNDVLVPGVQIGQRNHKLSGPFVYLSTDPGIALIFSKDFVRNGREPTVYEVEPGPACHKVEPHIADSHEWVASSAKVLRKLTGQDLIEHTQQP